MSWPRPGYHELFEYSIATAMTGALNARVGIRPRQCDLLLSNRQSAWRSLRSDLRFRLAVAVLVVPSLWSRR